MDKPEKIIEVERKWILKNIPREVVDYNALSISYAYTPNNERFQRIYHPGEEIPEYRMTHKIGEGIAREEITIHIRKEDFDKEWEDPKNAKIWKLRYEVPHLDGKLEIDLYTNIKLVSMEYEIKLKFDEENKEEKIQKFKNKDLNFPQYIKDVIIKEVTGEEEYSNRKLATID